MIESVPGKWFELLGSAAHFDVCLFCALEEEAQDCIREIERLCGVSFQTGVSARSGAYRWATIQNKKAEFLTIRVSWQLKAGPVEAGLLIYWLCS